MNRDSSRDTAISSAGGLLPLTASQREVVLSGGEHLLVGAGAGSGKTSTVVQAICYQLGGVVVDHLGQSHRAPGPLALADIAAITFTNQAAADLKRKLRLALKQSSLRQVAADVDTARIGTIHAFCGDLLRDFSLRAGLPPSVSVLDEGESRTLAMECAEQALVDAAAEDDIVAAVMSGRRVRDVAAAIVSLADDTGRLAAYQANRESLRDHERGLLLLAERAAARRHTALVERGAHDFDRMIVATRDLLRDHADVRRAVQRQIRLLIVDEFQDVDPVQRDIAMLLGGLDTGDPAPSRILLVGDPKQSIFRFRRADVTIWNDVAGRFASAGTGSRVLELSENFRSRKGILAFVDLVFGSAIQRPVDPSGIRQAYEVDYAPLDAVGPDREGDRCVELLCIPPDDDGRAPTATKVRVIEAKAVAQRVRILHEAGHAYGDMALLLAGWSDAAVYEEALRRDGIPVYVLRAEGFWDSREVIDCLLALRAIRDGQPSISDLPALVGFLKSPLVGVRDETLLALAEHPSGWRTALRDEPRERGLLDRACALLDRFQALRDRIPLGELVTRLVTETGFLAVLALDAGRGAQAAANVRKLIRLASDAGEQSLGEWLRDVSAARDREDLVAPERLYRERADVVTITSIHSAKGLEWPIVFWCDLVREARRSNDAVIVGRDLFRLKDTRLLDDEGEVADPVFAALQVAQNLEQLAEAYRLWYVAATRPRLLLVLSGIPLGKSTGSVPSVARLLLQRFAGPLTAVPVAGEIAYRHEDGSAFTLVVNVADADGVEVEGVGGRTGSASSADVPFAMPPEPIPTRMGRTRLSATQLMRFSQSPAAWWRTYVFGFDELRPLGRTVASGLAGHDAALQGTIVHEVLERFNFELADIGELIEDAIAHHDPDAADPQRPPSYRERIRELVDTAISHARWQELVGSPGARRELSFTRVLADGTSIEGAFDLAAVIDGATHILDVKTGGDRADSGIADQYSIQGATYVEAAQAISGGRPAHFALLRVSDGQLLPVANQGDGLMDLIARLRAAPAP